MVNVSRQKQCNAAMKGVTIGNSDFRNAVEAQKRRKHADAKGVAEARRPVEEADSQLQEARSQPRGKTRQQDQERQKAAKLIRLGKELACGVAHRKMPNDADSIQS